MQPLDPCSQNMGEIRHIDSAVLLPLFLRQIRGLDHPCEGSALSNHNFVFALFLLFIHNGDKAELPKDV